MNGEPTWQVLAQCEGDNAVWFFPPPHFEVKEEKNFREEHARTLCRRCHVREQCLDYALSVQEPHGIWGGLNEGERRRLLRRRSA